MVERTICSCRNGTESNSAKNGDDEEFGEHLDGKESKMRRIYDGNKMEMGCEYGDRLIKDEDWMRTGVQWEWVGTKYPMFLLYSLPAGGIAYVYPILVQRLRPPSPTKV